MGPAARAAAVCLALRLTVAEDYGIVHWRLINLMNLECELLIHPANHITVWSQLYHNLNSSIIANNFR